MHAEIIKKDEAEAEKEKKSGERLRKSESESSELRFLNTQQAHRIKAMEQELAREKKRVEELLQRHIASFVSMFSFSFSSSPFFWFSILFFVLFVQLLITIW